VGFLLRAESARRFNERNRRNRSRRNRYSTLGTVAAATGHTPTRAAGDISGVWLIVALLSMAMWIAYGGVTGAHAILWANLIIGVQAPSS
jgi:hypothetical protein